MLWMIYILLFVSLFVGLTAPIALFLAYFYRRDAAGWSHSHYTFQIYTFWMGLGLAIVSVLLGYYAFGPAIYLGIIGWLSARCVVGIKAVVDQKEIENPKTWLF